MTARILLVLMFAAAALAETPRSRFHRVVEEARAAQAAGDLVQAELKWKVALGLGDDAGIHPALVYSDAVTPLAKMYREQEETDKLEGLYQERVAANRSGLALGLAQADLGFYYQSSEVSADRFRGELLVEEAMHTFATCGSNGPLREHCRGRLADTAGLQGAVYFQQLKYERAEPLFRRVLAFPEREVQKEVLLVSMHALRGILILRKEYGEARKLELAAAELEAAHPEALARLRDTRDAEGTRARKR